MADEKKRKFCQGGGDLCTYLEIYKRWKEVDRADRFNWCVENYISSKALHAAAKTVKEIMFSLHAELNIRLSTRYNNSDFKKLYERVLFESFSENLCVLSGHPKLGYLSPYLPESFFIHPSSTLTYLGKDLPEFLVYSTLMETSRNFLFDVTPISEATIKQANQSNNFQLPLHSLKCLQVPPKALGPFGESVLIRYVLGKKGSKIKELEMKLQDLAKTKSVYVDVAVDKGLITFYLSQRFHERVSNHISQIITNAHTEMLNEEDVIKSAGTSMYFALTAGGIITDVVMPGEFRELVFNNVHPKSKDDLKCMLESYGPLQCVSDITSNKKENQVCVTFKKVSDAQRALADMHKKKMYSVSSKPYLPSDSDKTLPLHMLQISWCCHPCTGSGSVLFHSEEDLIVASSILTSSSFYLEDKMVIFSPSEKYSKELDMKNLPKAADEKSILAELSKKLPADVKVKKVELSRKPLRITDKDISETKQKLSKLLNQYISNTKFVVDLQDPRKGTSWNAFVYLESRADAEKLFVKLKNKTRMDSYPLSVKQVFKFRIHCTKEVYEAVSNQINSILVDKKAKKLCNDFHIQHQEKKFSVCVEFDCISFDELIETRKSLGQFLQGESMNFIGIPKYHFLFSDGHTQLIQKIRKSTNTFITVDKIKKIITLYGSSDSCKQAEEAIYSVVSNPEYSYTRTFNLRESCIPKGFMKKLYTMYGYDLHGLIDEFKLTVASVDNFGQTLTLKGLKSGIKKAEQKMERICEELFESRGQRANTSGEEVCPICFDPVTYDFHRLEHCGHAFCRQCLLLQMESRSMPLVCVKQNCGKLIFLEDIKRIISIGNDPLRKVFLAVALQYHVSCNVGKLNYCPTPDCQMIYRVTSEGSEFNCPSCQNSTCTRCQCSYHYGMSCEMFQNCRKDVDYSLKTWVKEKGSDRKYCPSCKTVIEKEGGCNHMQCLNCKVHLCWLCLKIFETDTEVYHHMPYCPNNQ